MGVQAYKCDHLGLPSPSIINSPPPNKQQRGASSAPTPPTHLQAAAWCLQQEIRGSRHGTGARVPRPWIQARIQARHLPAPYPSSAPRPPTAAAAPTRWTPHLNHIPVSPRR